MSTPGISLELIAQKVSQRRVLRNLKGEVIALDNQQLSIVRYMCHGLQHKQTAAEIGIGQRTISNIVAEVLRLTGCKTHAQLGAWAAKVGLV